jgi:atypical dual specificity phosphatase
MSYLDSRITQLNFSWIQENLVAGCRGPRTDQDIVFLRSLGIKALVRLAFENETGIGSGKLEENAIHDCYEPVPDWTAPSQAQIARVVGFINACVAKLEAVVVSCGAGYGRTGTILACYLVSRGLTPTAAIEKLITARPCSREILRVPGQKDAIFEYYETTKRNKRDYDTE